jgi:hypothetical protein
LLIKLRELNIDIMANYWNLLRRMPSNLINKLGQRKIKRNYYDQLLLELGT